MGQNIFYVGHNFSVGYVGRIYFCVGLCVGENILRGSKIFAWSFFFLRKSAFIYQMKLIYYSTTNSLDIFFVNLFPVNLEQALFDPFSIFCVTY